MDQKKAFQDYYPENLSYCYGCGRLNENGLKLKSYWDGDESIAVFTPKSYHLAIPGFVYGGLIASLIDCHGTGTASAAGYKAEGREMGTEPLLRYITASLHVDYLKPTPIDSKLVLKGKIEEITEKKVIVTVNLSAKGEVCAKGRVIAVKIPETMKFGK
ncbi:MAG: PaaI family thioesterase [Promethearchaeota archaeon]